jgi:hypothetical protein
MLAMRFGSRPLPAQLRLQPVWHPDTIHKDIIHGSVMESMACTEPLPGSCPGPALQPDHFPSGPGGPRWWAPRAPPLLLLALAEVCREADRCCGGSTAGWIGSRRDILPVLSPIDGSEAGS